MAFDNRHTEFLVLAVLIGPTTAISLPVLRFLGCEGWYLGMAVVGCVAVSYGLLLLLLHLPDSFKRLKGKSQRKP